MIFVWLACQSPCADPDACRGTLTADLTGERPIFSVDDVGVVEPDQIAVSLTDGCDGAEMETWEVWSIPPGNDEIEYGTVPRGSREVIAAAPLVEGSRYLVYVARHEGLIPDGSAGGPSTWVGSFTWGDAESFTLELDCPI